MPEEERRETKGERQEKAEGRRNERKRIIRGEYMTYKQYWHYI